jgi:hypothetical protein
MNTTEILLERIASIRNGIADLLNRSSMSQMDRDWGRGVWLGPTGAWGELDIEARRVQSRILEEYGRFFETISVLLRGQPPEAQSDLATANLTIREVLEQSELSWIDSVDEARSRALEALDTQAALLERLHDAGEGVDVYVPDTNALLHYPDLERWTFDGSPRFELILTPSILVELDELKVNHRNIDVRYKAEGLISRIKGYRSRGQLTRGVPLLKRTSSIRALATEPRMANSLPWLDPDNRDDRFIGSVIEIMRQHPRSAVTIVTRDINLQSKAELASIPFSEPPDPT